MADWKLNYKTFEGLYDHPKVEADLERRQSAGITAARAVCPRSEDGRNGQPAGHLASTIRGERGRRGVRRIVYGNETTARYAWIIEWGSRAHEIRRRPGGPMLHWVDADGVHHFRERVWHPGTRPYRVLTGAALDAASLPA